MKKKKKLVSKILKRGVIAMTLVGLLIVGLVVFASVDWIDESKFGPKPTVTPVPTQSSAPAVINQGQGKPAVVQTKQELSLEDRQKLGAKRAELEEAIRKNEESKQKLYSALDTLLAQCQKVPTDNQCWDDYRKSQDEINQAVRDIDEKNAKARTGISEINALLGS